MTMERRVRESLKLGSRGESSWLEGGGDKHRKRALQVAAWQEYCAGGQSSDPKRVAPRGDQQDSAFGCFSYLCSGRAVSRGC